MQLMEFITQIESGQSVVQQVTVHGAGTVGQSGNGPTHWHQAPGSGVCILVMLFLAKNKL